MNTSIPEIKNPLTHSGTHRFERLAKEMDFSYVQIEERHESDFLTYAHALASQFQFYDSNNLPVGTWKEFFDPSLDSSRPHKALFIAFLRLLEALNEHANGLTKRHLDFYYKEVLQFTQREAAPQSAHLFFTCAQSLSEKFLTKGATVYAGKNEDGKQLLFELVDEIVVNKAQLTQCLALFQHDSQSNNRLFTKDYSDSILGKNSSDKGFPLFGENQLTYYKDGDDFKFKLKEREDQTMVEPQIGFAISSPLLKLDEGRRIITVKLTFEKNNEQTPLDSFRFHLTSEEDWFEINKDIAASVSFLDGNSDEIEVNLVLQPTDPKVIAYDSEIHLGSYTTTNPILKVTLDHSSNEHFGYPEWKKRILSNISLKVKAEGVRSLKLQNELTPLDPSKPFRPFGPIPAIGSHFYVGHPDLFQHELEYAQIHINWKDLPSESLEDHYADYSAKPKNQDFRIQTATLENRNWKNIQQNVRLFEDNAKLQRTISLNFLNYTRKANNNNAQEWNYETHHGFIRWTLTKPDNNNFRAFGNTVYAKEMLRNNQLANPVSINQPYAPVIESLTMDFETKEVTFFDPHTYGESNPLDHFFHVGAFGETNILIDKKQKSSPLIPQYNHEGECFLGFKEVNPPQSLSVLFQFNEGTADANLSTINSGIEWFYLTSNDWQPISKLEISKDTTRNLLNTGVIRFDLPESINSLHQKMPNELFWIKGVKKEKTAGLDFIQGIHTQAIELVEQDPNLNSETIAPDTISKLVDGNKGLSSINQSYASFGGRPADSEHDFYARSTERLRHKDRGIMIWDYERLLLDSFPYLYKVKCLNHTNYQTEMVPGHVMLAVVPNLRKQGVQSPFQPKLSIHKRMEMYDFLRERISPFIYLRVENPIYEPIRLSFNVGFHEGKDEGFYGKKLHQQLQEFLSPWAFDNEWTESNDLVFGGILHKSTILKFIEDLPYVDFVNDFNLLHIYQDPTIALDFEKEINNPPLPDYHASYAVSQPDTAADIIKMAFQVEDENELTSLIRAKVRFLKGVINLPAGQTIEEKFIKQLHKSIDRRAKKGDPITKTMVRIIIKNMFYVDQIVDLDFYKILPDGYIMEDTDAAEAKTSRSIMVTSEQHRIGVYRAGDYNCEGNVVIGIGFMIVEADFIIPEINETSNEYQAR